MQFTREKIWDLWGEAWPLLMEHWQEIARYKDIKLNPDFDAYHDAEMNGLLRVYTARAEGLLIGYAAFFVKKNAHYKDSLQAVQDVVFLRKECRRGFVGIKLLEYADAQLANEGVQVVYQHVKVRNNFSPILKRIGYEKVEEVWAKRLDVKG